MKMPRQFRRRRTSPFRTAIGMSAGAFMGGGHHWYRGSGWPIAPPWAEWRHGARRAECASAW